MKNFKISGGMLVFLGALFWSLNAPLVKFINVDALLTAGCRATIAGVVLLPFLRPKKLNWGPWMLVYLAAYCGLSVGIVLALRATSSAIAIGMQYASIVWLFLVNTYLTKKLDKKRLVPVIMISVGVILFMMTGLEGSTMVGNLIALTESISFAFMTVGVKKAGKDNVLGLTCLANLFTAFFVFAFLPPKVTDVLAFSGQDWLIIFLLGVVNVAFGYAFYNTGVARTTPQKAAVIALWEMILAPTWTAIFLHEYPSLMVIVGFVIIIAGIFVDAKVDSPAKA
ncbi:MAG: DMT family transporter [Firmicutes bacterium]|nr:DMT family transporter [Bacillota bacterium]MBR2002150.1 DMT family transporter [Bacillota bacterium]MBR7148731.1 DMT family transporter [Bacillota bacterium]